MDFTEALAKLEKLDAAVMPDAVEVKQAILERLGKVNKENQTLRDRTGEADQLRKLLQEHAKVAEGADLAAIKDQLAQLAAAKGSGDDSALAATVAKLQRELEQERTERRTAVERQEVGERVAAISKHLQDAGMFADAAELFAKEHAANFKRDTQGDLVGPEGVTLKEWGTKFLQGKERFIENKGAAGAGAGPAGGPGAPKGGALADKGVTELLAMAIRGEGMGPAK